MPRNQFFSNKLKAIHPGISMMAAIDNYGDVYWTLLQANSHAITFELVLYKLVKTLDKERPTWRNDTIL